MDSLGNFVGIGYTANERKRDKYKSLYKSIEDKHLKADDEIDKADSRFGRCCAYGDPQTPGEPATAYVNARQYLDEDYHTIKEKLKQALSEAGSARSVAYQKYCHYQTMADLEDN